MRDGGEYLDSLSKALIRHKHFTKWGDLAGRRNKREREGQNFGRFRGLLGGGRWGTGTSWFYPAWET
jgi:hypothetical protein